MAAAAAEFQRQGFVVLRKALAPKLPQYLGLCHDLVARANAREGHADWNSGGFVQRAAADTFPKEQRLLKVQSVAVEEPSILEVFRQDPILDFVHYFIKSSRRANEDPEIDVFGTKFFPSFPGGTTVSWHQDSHFFGTSSPSIVSMAVYLEDTDKTNGCLQVVPGSHITEDGATRPHSPGEGELSQGEWSETPASEDVLDIDVPAGSVVLFDARLLHAARQNQSKDRTRFSLFGHYVPGDLDFSWKGVDFSRGAYADRHRIA